MVLLTFLKVPPLGREEMAERRILNSWKEIASYLGRGVRTVQRWETQLGLPVHRPAGRDHSAVLAFSNELDQWLDSRPVRRSLSSAAESASIASTQAVELQALLRRAEILLEKLELMLSRNEEMHRKLLLTVNAQANDPIQQDLRGSETLGAARGEAA